MDKKGKIAFTLSLILVGLLVIGLVFAGPKGKGRIKAQCNDKIDNDGDGYCDFLSKNKVAVKIHKTIKRHKAKFIKNVETT